MSIKKSSKEKTERFNNSKKLLITASEEKKAIKPVQEWFSRTNNIVTMPLSKFIVKYTNISATQLTLFSIVVGVFSGFFLAISGFIKDIYPSFFMQEYSLRLIGGLLAYLFGVLDGVDGKVARLRNQSTHTGKWWDGVAGHTSISLIFLGLAIGLRSYFALLLAFIACVSYLIAYLQIAIFKNDFDSYMKNQNLELIKDRKSWTYWYGMSLVFLLVPLATILDYPMIPLYFYSTLAPLFYLAVLYFQKNTVNKIK